MRIDGIWSVIVPMIVMAVVIMRVLVMAVVIMGVLVVIMFVVAMLLMAVFVLVAMIVVIIGMGMLILMVVIMPMLIVVPMVVMPMFIAVIMGLEPRPSPITKPHQAIDIGQHHRLRVCRAGLNCTSEPGGQPFAHPEDKVRVGQPPHIGRAHRIAMRRRSLREQNTRRADPVHHLRNKRVDRGDIRHYFRGSGAGFP